MCAARENIPVYYLPRLRSTNVDRFNERKWLYTGKGKEQKIPPRTIMDTDYADDIMLQANTPAQAESLLHSLEWTAGGIGLHVNADTIEFLCFNQRGDISSLNGGSLKLVDKFTYLRSSISSTENDINTWLTKAWIAIDRLSVIYKSYISDRIKRSFFQAAVVSVLLHGSTTWTLTERMERKLDGNCTRMLRDILGKSWRQHIIFIIMLYIFVSMIIISLTHTHIHKYTHTHIYIYIYYYHYSFYY